MVTQGEKCNIRIEAASGLWSGLTWSGLVGASTAVYFVPNHLGLYSVKVISTENSVQRLRNKKLNKTKCDFLGQIRLVTSTPDSPTPSPPLGGMGVNI